MAEPYCGQNVIWRRVRGMASNLRTSRTGGRLFSMRVLLAAFKFIAPVCLVLLICLRGQAQTLTVRISVVSLADPATVKVEGGYPQGSSVWSFRNAYGRVTGLGDRIHSLALADQNGAKVAVRTVGPGEFKADHSATQFTYEVSLSHPSNPADAAHISGLNDQYGYLMPADLLPILPTSSLRLEFQLPTTWRLVSSPVANPLGGYDLPDASNAVFFLGRDLREKRKRVGATEFVFVTAGEWPFAGDAVTEIAARIIKDHRKQTGFAPDGRIFLMLAPFPGTFGSERWSAETRGSNVVLLLGRNSRPKPLLGQISVVLCHELFHVWVPNALSLKGDYDWFFEGFTLYQALRCAVRLGFIDFQEYLDTLGRVYDSYLAMGERDSLSLVEASRRRWTSGSSLVYDKGMLAAFLYDLKLREASKNRRSLDVVYQELFRRFVPGTRRVDGNELLISLLIEQDGDDQFTRRYIEIPSSIDLEAALPSYGIQVRDSGHLKRLLVSETLNARQRTLLDSLGFRK